MVSIICGEKGKGKTKVILEKVNKAAESANGNIVFVDGDNSHMYELKNSIRLVNTSEYNVNGADEFYGFIAGIISADHDLEELYIDRLLVVAGIDEAGVENILTKINKIAEQNNVKCTISVSVTKEQLGAKFGEMVEASL